MEQLGKRLAQGDQCAFGELYDACADRLYRYLVARLGSTEGASDVLQTVFLQAVAQRRRFKQVENPAAYLFGIARNEATKQLKRLRQTARRENINVSEHPDVASGGLSLEDAETVAAALEKLEADDRELIELKIFGGMTFQEIANLTDRPLGTVATRYRRAMESLRKWLSNQLK